MASEIDDTLNASGESDFEVTYNTTTRKITIANPTLTTFTLPWSTGTNADECCGLALGFDNASDDTRALTYTARWPVALRVEMGQLS